MAAIRDLAFDGVAPTITELGEHLGITSRSSTHRLLCGLKARRLIDWLPRQPRSIQITNDAVSPAVLSKLSDECLRSTAALIAGILAQRMGGGEAQAVLRRIADRLPGANRRAA